MEAAWKLPGSPRDGAFGGPEEPPTPLHSLLGEPPYGQLASTPSLPLRMTPPTSQVPEQPLPIPPGCKPSKFMVP